MSRDLIKRSEFVELCLLPDPRAEKDGPPRFGSTGARVRDLVQRLGRADEEARERAERAAEEARRETRVEMEREFGDALRSLRAAAAALAAAREREKEVAVEEIVHLAVAIAGKIVRREIRRDDESVVRLVRRCLRRIPFPAPVRVRLNPVDIARVTAARDALAPDEAAHRLTFDEDRRVERGGCVVETPDFVVDGRARIQLAAAREALEGEA